VARERELKVVIAGDASGFNKSVKSVKGGLGGLGKSAGVAAGALAAVGVAAVGALAVKGVNASMEFDQSMREVFTLLPGISDEAMGGMKDQVKDFSKEFGVLPDEVVPALYSSLSAGVPKDNVFAFLETAQMAAKGGVTELETAVDGISSVVNAYGDDVITATEASDQMFTAVKLGKTTFGELSASLSNVTPISSGLGISFAEVSAGLAAMTAKGVPTAVATTQLKTLFSELGKDGSKAALAFEQFSDKSFPDFIKGGGSIEDALKLVNQSAMVSGTGIQNMFGSVEAGAAALTLFDNETFTDAVDEMGNSAGATEAAFETMDQGLGPMLDKAKAWGSVMLIEIGDKVIPLLESAVEWIEAHWPEISATFAAVSAVVMDVVGEVSKMFEKHWPAIQETVLAVFEAISDAVEEHWPTIQEIIETVVEILAEVFETFAGIVEEQWPAIQETITAVMETIGEVIDRVVRVIMTVWSLFGDDILGAIQRVWPRIQQIISGVMTFVQGIINTVMALIRGDWGAVWEGIKQTFRGVWEAIQGILGTFLEYIRLSISMALEFITTIWEKVWGGIKAFFGLVWDGIVLYVTTYIAVVRTIIETALGVISAIWNGAWNAISDFVSTIWSTITGTISTVVETVKSTITDGFNTARDTAIGAVQAIIDFVAGLPRAILDLVGKITDAALDIGSSIVSGILDGLAGFAEGAAGFAGDVVSAVGDVARDAINAVIQAINDLLPNTVGQVKVKGITIFPGLDLPDNPIPSLHTGGRYSAPVPGGEGLALLRDGETVSPRGRSAGTMGAPQVIQLIVDGRVLTEAIVRDTNRNGPAQIKVAG